MILFSTVVLDKHGNHTSPVCIGVVELMLMLNNGTFGILYVWMYNDVVVASTLDDSITNASNNNVFFMVVGSTCIQQ